MGAGPRLFGRAQAQETLSAAWVRAREGTGRLVLVSGEPGIGKSSLLAWLAGQAVGSRVLRGFCWQGPGCPPYWPWTQVLRGTGLAPAELGEAARLLDPAGHDEVDDAAAAVDAQFRLMQAVTDVVLRLSADGVTVVLLDDLQWADDGSLQLLSFLARSTPAAAVLMVGAYRDTEVVPPLLLQLGTSAEHLPLTGLSRPQVDSLMADLAGQQPQAEVVDAVWRRSGGNPFFVRELTRLLQSHGPTQSTPHLPAQVVDTVRRRLARLPSDTVGLLEWAAVAGSQIDIDLLADCTGQDVATVADRLAAGAAVGIIVQGDGFRFAHDIHREALLEGMGPSALTAAHLRVGRLLRDRGRPGTAAEVAVHLAQAGPSARAEAGVASEQAAREATQRLGHEDACRHLERALDLLGDDDPGTRARLLLELAGAADRAGRRDTARSSLLQVAELAQARGDAPRLARAALGLQALGARSGEQAAQVIHLLEDADSRLSNGNEHRSLRSTVLSALTRAHRHGVSGPQDLVGLAEQAVDLATASGDRAAVATALLALHDAMWAPGTAAPRLDIATRMRDAATAAGDEDLAAQATQLRAATLLELGDPAGREELLEYVRLAQALGHARGRWAALTRRATYAQLAGHVDEAVRLGEEALQLGLAIGEPDAIGCFCTQRWSLTALGAREPDMPLEDGDPLWPMLPLIRAWPHAVRGDLDRARRELGDFSVLDITPTYDLEKYAVAAVVFAAVGSTEQRQWAYHRLLPHAGLHVVVGGAAAYHAAVDHHLGALAESLEDYQSAHRHFRAALRMHHRVGAPGWARLSQRALAGLAGSHVAHDDFHLHDGRWVLSYTGRRVSLPDAKGLRDVHTLIAAAGAEVHVLDLLGPHVAATVGRSGADPVLDDRAKAEYRRRLDDLAEGLDSAARSGDAPRAERLEAERSAILTELASATGLGGRDRRLGDATERARKTVGARIRDSLNKIDQVHPQLAAHLRASLHLGTTCTYRPDQPVQWRLTT